MSDPRVEAAVATAVAQAFDAWAAEHPTLASVIDRLAMSEQAAESKLFKDCSPDTGKSMLSTLIRLW